ncbi:MAG: hypothetical protein APR62_05445 [Smithella sp. SDB]|nr:MAG: hypothetical protein APR62_05445 [Smithella sp. SDB]
MKINQKTFIALITIVLLFLSVGQVLAGKKEIKARLAFLPSLEKHLNEKFMIDPVITLEGKDKTILIIESIRLEDMDCYMIAGSIIKTLRILGFKKIVFIRQRYNAKEFDGRIYDVETGEIIY